MHVESKTVKFRGCGRINPQPDWKLPEHVHSDFHEMILVVQGQIETHIRGQVIMGQRGDVLLYPKGQPHSERAVGGKSLETLFVSWEGMAAPTDFPLHAFDRDGRIEQQFRWMYDLFPTESSEARKILDLLMHTSVYEYRRLAVTPLQSEMVLRIKRFIRNRIADPITLDDLAGEAGLSRFYFARAFRDQAGVSPMNYLRRLRVEAAQALILRTPLPLKSIATQVGFADEFHFSRVFHQVTGQAPGALRKRA
jgi:AraC-like DNA-binding protein